jgi:hypothetical protein
MLRKAKHTKRQWMPNPAKLLGVIFVFSILFGLVVAVSSMSTPTGVLIAAKSGCNIVSTKEGPGCWCSDGGWQWHCGGQACSTSQQQACASENGVQQVVASDPSAENNRCKLGEWACGSYCADAQTQKLFNATWKDGKSQWLLEAGCGGVGGGGKNTGTAVADETCSSNSITSIGCQGKSIGTQVALSGGKACVCAFTTKPDCACVVTNPSPTRVSRGMQRETTSPALEDGVTNTTGLQKRVNPTDQPAALSGDASNPKVIAKCSADYFTDSACRGGVPGASCIDDGWFSSPKEGVCEKVGSGNRCECKMITTSKSSPQVNKTNNISGPETKSDSVCPRLFFGDSSCKGQPVGSACTKNVSAVNGSKMVSGTCQGGFLSSCSCK